MNKKSIGIIIAVVFVLLVGIIGGTDQSTNADSDTTQALSSLADESVVLSENDTEFSDEDATDAQKKPEEEVKESENLVEKTDAQATTASQSKGNYKVSLSSVPAFSGKAYTVINNNIPGLSKAEQTSTYFEKYTALDYLGRCGVAFACLGRETMPTEERGAIGSVKPSGWQTVKYDFVDGRYLYNRCHLIGFQLSGENANTRNLITGTRYMNVQGMLPFENMVADYIKETGNHVLYRVTPVFKGSELVCRGVQIEAFSVEDNGDGICFNVYCYNNQPGVEIDYSTGSSWLSDRVEETTNKAITTTKKAETTTHSQTQSSSVNTEMVWLPKSGKRYHRDSTCSGMKEATKATLQEAIDSGYTACGRCY